jgi:hypothetical protein
MLILTPGVFAVLCKPILRNDNLDDKNKKVYPIELHIGGTLSNIGIKEAHSLSSGDGKGILTFFFESADIQSQWVKAFQRATGSHDINDYYIMYDKHEQLEDEEQGFLNMLDNSSEDMLSSFENGNEKDSTQKNQILGKG